MSARTCERCKAEYTPTQPRGQYCPECCQHFRDVQSAARQRSNTPTAVLVGKFAAPPDCPRAHLPETGTDYFCGLCGSPAIEPEYGFCCFGLGMFNRCTRCGIVQSFTEDTGE